MMLILCQRKGFKKIKQFVMDYRYESTFNQCKGKIDLLNAYIIGDYKSVIKLCEESVDFKNKEDKLAMYNHSMYQFRES